MASQPAYRYELIKLAEKLDKDYYPLTELLCKNARVQAEWLQAHNIDAGAYLKLCGELNEQILFHMAMTKEIIAEFKDNKIASAILNSADFRRSRKAIERTLIVIREEATGEKMKDWKEMHENLKMQLLVLNNLLTELFRIEDADLIPLLERHIPLN
jgi:hypothetical protein